MRFAAALAAAGLSLLILAAVALPAGHQALAQPATTTIQVGDYYFCDPSYQNGVCETAVDEGDTVEWQFVGSQPHSTTECSDGHDTCSAPHLWDSPLMDSGSFSFTFDTPGAYLYRCQAHPIEMRGQVTVLAAAQPTPSPQASAPTATPTPTPTTAVQPAVVPSAGGAPPAGGDAMLSWLAVVGGGMMVAAAAVIAARGLRRDA
jgi:hypothetical protein